MKKKHLNDVIKPKQKWDKPNARFLLCVVRFLEELGTLCTFAILFRCVIFVVLLIRSKMWAAAARVNWISRLFVHLNVINLPKTVSATKLQLIEFRRRRSANSTVQLNIKCLQKISQKIDRFLCHRSRHEATSINSY